MASNFSAVSKQTTLRFLSPLLAISAGSCVVLSLDTMVAAWVALFWTVSCVLAFIAFYRGANQVFSYDFRLITVLLLVGLTIAAHWTRGWQFVLAQSLVIMLGIKLMELRSQRDAFQFCGLGVLGLGVASLTRFDLGFGVMIFIFLFLGLVLILWQHVLDQTGKLSGVRVPGWIFSLKLTLFAFFLTILTVALGLVLFFAFPRNINPMLNLGAGLEIHRTGFSPEMNPGSVSEIVASNRVAFRAKIDGDINPASLYWRGAVLWETDGTAWTPGTPHDFQVSPPKPSARDAEVISQSVTLNPGRSEYLFGLFFPGQVADYSPVFYNPDRSIKTEEPPDVAIRYQVFSSYTDFRSLSVSEKMAGLATPEGLDQRIVDLASELGSNAADAGSLARSVMQYFSIQEFEYSLSSPSGYPLGQTLTDFLFETKTGYCELFASAATILLRLNNIPSRVVVGFWGGEFNPVGEYWIIRDSMAHAWVEAWLENEGWVILDPTRTLDADVLDQQGEVLPSETGQGVSTTRMVAPSMRVVDWLRWQWTNAIIDLTLARQVRMWRSFRSGIQETWSGFAVPELSLSRDVLQGGKVPVAVTVLMLAGGLILAVRLFRKRCGYIDPGDRFRSRAWKRLAGKTPGRSDLRRPGREEPVWDWWENNHPDRVRELKSVYYAQRYGPDPDLEKDMRLKVLLSGK